MTREKNTMDLTGLERVLDIFGAESARWPRAERDRLLELVRTDERARALLAEARALDELMAHAPAGRASPELAARIVAAAVADGAQEATVVPIGAGRSGSRSRFAVRHSMILAPAAVLAASFALGLYLGLAVVGQTSFATPFETAAVDAGIDDVDALFAVPGDAGAGQGGVL